VLNVSDLWPISAIELGAVKEGSMYHKVMLRIERFLYKKASAYQGQSQQTIDHIESFNFNKQHFLYRNLQPQQNAITQEVYDRSKFKIVYAGLLGVAQDILGIIQHINFKEIGAELHIYGGGNQAEAIQQYIKESDCGVVFEGYQPKETINNVLGGFHASIVPLAVAIKGAVPSKIFDLLPHGTPILFAGGGEGETIVTSHGFGLCSKPGDYNSLKENILKLKTIPESEYQDIRKKCIIASQTDFSFENQMKNYYQFLCQLS
jgi:glycosyltransferase involved in cell wall biosynthesis